MRQSTAEPGRTTARMLPFDVLSKIADLLPVKALRQFAAVDTLANSASGASAKTRAGMVVADLAELKTCDFKRNLRIIDGGDRRAVVVDRMKKAVDLRNQLIRALHTEEPDHWQLERWSQLHKHYHIKVVLLLNKIDRLNRELIELAEGTIAFAAIQSVSDASDGGSESGSDS